MRKNLIDLDDQSIEWIRAKGGVLLVRESPRHGCCGGSAVVAVAETPASGFVPQKTESFIEFRQAGLQVFLSQSLSEQTPLRIRLDGFWKCKRLFVENTAMAGGRV